jgi:urease accessory protein
MSGAGAAAIGTGRGRRAFDAHAVIRTERVGGTPSGTRLVTLRSDPPLTLRRTGPARVHMVASAAGPLGGDRLRLDIDVAAGTVLEVESIASTLVLPGEGRSSMTVTARVGERAVLRFAPEPTVVAAGCDHETTVRLDLAPGASVLWREEIVFGRHGESPGRCRARFDATAGTTPLLRQELVIGDPAAQGPAVYGTARCVGSTLLVAGALATEGARVVLGDGVAVLPLAAGGALVTALAPDATALRERLVWGEGQGSTSPARMA